MEFHEIGGLMLQILVVWFVVFSLWMALAGMGSLNLDNPVKKRRVKLAALIFSVPSWILIVGLVLYRVWIDGSSWPPFNMSAILCCFCVVLSIVSQTMFLISMNDYAVRRLEIVSIVWAALPLLFIMFLGSALWLSNNF
jgi:hypothetical protein